MELTKQQIRDYQLLADETLAIMKRQDFSVIIDSNVKEAYEEEDVPFAETLPNIWRKTLTITFYDKLFEREDEYVAKVVIHEVIHGMMGVQQELIKEQMRTTSYIFEEEFVNSITNAVAKAILK